MKKLRIYVDTSVLGGCFDPEFSIWSKGLIDDFRSHRYRPILSDVTAAEIRDAPDSVQDLHADLLAMKPEILRLTPESLELLKNYEKRGILGVRFRNDMLHIALATIAEVDVLVSWNFRHIVRLDKIRLFNAVNMEQGYKPLQIYSPREVASHERESED
jgi:hypothetical protein